MSSKRKSRGSGYCETASRRCRHIAYVSSATTCQPRSVNWDTSSAKTARARSTRCQSS